MPGISILRGARWWHYFFTSSSMDTMTLALFRTQECAENVINELSRIGIPSKDISIVVKDEVTGACVKEGVVSSLGPERILVGITSILAGIGALAIPGVGGILMAGPCTVALTDVLAGGLIGGLLGLGLPNEDALLYGKDLEIGGILLSIPTTAVSEGAVNDILRKHHASQIRIVNRKTISV